MPAKSQEAAAGVDVTADLHPEPADQCALAEVPPVAMNLSRVPALGRQLLEGAQTPRCRVGRDDALLTEHRKVCPIKPMHRLIGRHPRPGSTGAFSSGSSGSCNRMPDRR